MPGIDDKVVVITGASSGIGEATALLLAERGAKLVLGARRADRLKALADRIAKAGGAAVYEPTDVKRRDDLSQDLFRAAGLVAGMLMMEETTETANRVEGSELRAGSDNGTVLNAHLVGTIGRPNVRARYRIASQEIKS
jgi:NADP-dependent 3-hydroxy acid dehydrogenase YdfG